MIDHEHLYLSDIQELQKQLAKAEKRLHGEREGKKKDGDPAYRFYDEPPVDSITILINENGGKMKREKIVEKLKAGGYGINKKTEKLRDQHINRSIKDNVDVFHNLVRVEGDYIDIPR